jgi:hypothetical protein
MRAWQLTRRAFLQVAGALGLTTVAGCCLPNGRFPTGPQGKGVYAFKRSGRGRNTSKASDAHSANHIYPTFEAACCDLAHLGDNAKVVRIVIHEDLFNQYFGNGQASVDLRHVL